MSIDAMKWAKPIKTGRSSSKAVLTWLADMCGADLTAYPSIAALADATELNVKTVQASLKHLVELGLIEDTGERRGLTRQVVVYRLVGVNESYADSEHTQKRLPCKPTKNGGVNNSKDTKNGNVTKIGCVNANNTTENGCVSSINDPDSEVKDTQKRDTESLRDLKDLRSTTLTRQSGGNSSAPLRDNLITLLQGTLNFECARELHDAVESEILRAGYLCQREFTVVDRGDGRKGRIDLLVSDLNGLECGIEIDWKTHREKSVAKLQQVSSGFILLREAGVAERYEVSGIPVVNANHVEIKQQSLTDTDTVLKPDSNDLAHTASKLIDHLNRNLATLAKKLDKPTPMGFRAAKQNITLIAARLKDNFTQTDCELVLDYLTEMWGADVEMREYLCPTSIFRPSKFDDRVVKAHNWNNAGRPVREGNQWDRSRKSSFDLNAALNDTSWAENGLGL